MESEHESESNEHLIKDADNSRNMDEALFPVMSAKKSDHDSRSEAEKYIDFNEETSGSAEMSKTSHSSSYSGSSSDYFQIDAKMPQKSSTFPVVSPEPQEDSQSKNHGQNSPSQPSSQVSQATNKSTLQTPSPIESPPIQVMEKAGGYDPNRIPDSVFGRSSSAMDWSVASNESLFSLHLGNNSFSREQFLLMSGELYSSGELNKPSEAAKPGRPPLIPIGKLQEEEAVDSDNKPKETKAAEEKMDDSLELDVSDQPEEKESEAEVNGHSSMINRPSDASGTSTQSFAFPMQVSFCLTKTDHTFVDTNFLIKMLSRISKYRKHGFGIAFDLLHRNVIQAISFTLTHTCTSHHKKVFRASLALFQVRPIVTLSLLMF
ncbi:hypothetical protein DCAR_0727806 [Daucus carota subsp. sativus]|uniref:Uncharacterized protein n=1 Tax=Daucus carota subsp. sativus TaxID=79200 RepID=A0AAF0XJT6_DAUCS|nr:hypothetical protein DCAR_0727806 [Daucus carota subsp. sativus]